MKNILIAGLIGLAVATPAFAATIIVNNVDAPNVGFNDPTPAAPVGGNGGTTVGAQRLIAYQKALELWGKTLASNATIVVQGSFARISCTATGGTLAQAGAIQIFANFPNAPLDYHWYGVALANAIAGADLTPGPLDPGPLGRPHTVAEHRARHPGQDKHKGSSTARVQQSRKQRPVKHNIAQARGQLQAEQRSQPPRLQARAGCAVEPPGQRRAQQQDHGGKQAVNEMNGCERCKTNVFSLPGEPEVAP